jgi:hypothetical protein
MIDLMQEHLVAVRDIPKLLPPRPNGRPIHLSACYRWMEKGVHGARLESIRIGGTTYTSREALQRFANHQTHQADAPPGERVVPSRPRRPGRATELAAQRAQSIFAPRHGAGFQRDRWAPPHDTAPADTARPANPSHQVMAQRPRSES